MAKIYQQYTREIRDALGYLATWSPGAPLRLGDIGVMDGHAFIPQSSLGSMGITFDVRKDGQAIDFDYSSRNAVEISVHADADGAAPGGQAKGTVDVKFSRESATVFSCLGCVEHRIADILTLQEEVSGRFKAGIWHAEWVVVSHLVAAESATILIADAKGSEISFAASGSLQGAALRLGDANLGLGMTAVKAVSNRWVAADGLTPLFRGIGVRRGLLGSPYVGPVQRIATSRGEAPAAEELGEDFVYYDYE